MHNIYESSRHVVSTCVDIGVGEEMILLSLSVSAYLSLHVSWLPAYFCDMTRLVLG